MENNGEAVLLVDDSEEDAFFFKRALAKSGISAELLFATDGKAAISILSDTARRSRIGLIFLDLKLPLLSGFDVLRWVNSQHFDPPLRIIVLSGSAHKSDQTAAHELGVMDYLVKPITPEVIRKCFF